MIKFDKLAVILICVYFVNTNKIFASTTNTLDRKQARNYIGHIIDTLFIPTNHSGKYERELRNFVDDVTYVILRAQGHYPSSFSFSKVYKTEELYRAVVEESINFIKEKSAEYIREAIRTIYIHERINRQDIVYNVKTRLNNEVRYLIDRSGDLQVGVFTNYYGVPLVNKINSMIQEEIQKFSNISPSPKPTYPSIPKPTYTNVYATDECPICFEKFDSISSYGLRVKRLVLKCGHNICVDCLRAWVKEKGNAVNCPMCRASINISDFADELWPPSAPSY